MTVVAIYKWARDPELATVQADGTLNWRNAKMTFGENDHLVVKSALELDPQSVGLTIGDGDASWALARGLQSTISVPGVPDLLDNAHTAQILAAATRTIPDVDVILIGDSDSSQGVAPVLAAALHMPCIIGVESIEENGDSIVVSRRSHNLEEHFTITGPIVISMAAAGPELKAPGMKQVLAARKRPVTAVDLADLGLDAVDSVVSNGTHFPQATKAHIFAGSPTQKAEQLISALRADGAIY